MFLQAARGEATERTPVWFMRQAGRSLPEYRAIRAEHEMLEMCRDPEIATEVTLQPVRRLGVDAAVLFSDIVIQLQGMGVDLAIEPGIGPVIKNPITSMADVAALEPLEPERDVPFVIETIENLVGELDVPLIGFAGAPFTLASYLIEGGPSKDHAKTKAFMHSQPATFRSLLTRLRTSGAIYLAAQAAAGASALQVFDSWAGALAPADYEAHVLEHMSALFHDLAATGVPRIHFGVVTGELLELMNSAGPDVMGIDWRVPLDKARARLPGVPLQGNLDPALLLAPWDVTERAAADVLRRGGGRGHIFNLGHGVLPDTDPGQLRRLVDFVQAWPSDGDS
ncbi:MAG: uroporphyrinogen decarboxylase [Actinomycetota bacterium]